MNIKIYDIIEIRTRTRDFILVGLDIYNLQLVINEKLQKTLQYLNCRLCDNRTWSEDMTDAIGI